MPDPAQVRHQVGTVAGAGVLAGPLAWLATQQATYLLSSWGCSSPHPRLILAIDLLGAALALASAWLCWRQWRPEDRTTMPARAERSFTAGLGALLGCLFAYAMLTQGLGALFFTGCER